MAQRFSDDARGGSEIFRAHQRPEQIDEQQGGHAAPEDEIEHAQTFRQKLTKPTSAVKMTMV